VLLSFDVMQPLSSLLPTRGFAKVLYGKLIHFACRHGLVLRRTMEEDADTRMYLPGGRQQFFLHISRDGLVQHDHYSKQNAVIFYFVSLFLN